MKIKFDISIEYPFNPPQSLEQLYYRTIFEMIYPNFGYIIPYFWMPKYVNANDASARTLDIYNDNVNNIYDEESKLSTITLS